MKVTGQFLRELYFYKAQQHIPGPTQLIYMVKELGLQLIFCILCLTYQLLLWQKLKAKCTVLAKAVYFKQNK